MRHENNETIGQRITLIRAQDRRDVFAMKAGIHPNTLANFERGVRLPSPEFLSWLYDQGVDLNWLITGEGSRMRSSPYENTVPKQEHRTEEEKSKPVDNKKDELMKMLVRNIGPDTGVRTTTEKAELVAALYKALVHGLD